MQYEPEAEGGEKLVEELLSAMEGTFNRNDYQSVFPEGLTAAVSTLKDGRLTIDFNDAYKQMDDTREVLPVSYTHLDVYKRQHRSYAMER